LDGVEEVAQFGAGRFFIAGDRVFTAVFVRDLQRILKPVGLAFFGRKFFRELKEFRAGDERFDAPGS
jgi:hypothetical protein